MFKIFTLPHVWDLHTPTCLRSSQSHMFKIFTLPHVCDLHTPTCLRSSHSHMFEIFTIPHVWDLHTPTCLRSSHAHIFTLPHVWDLHTDTSSHSHMFKICFAARWGHVMSSKGSMPFPYSSSLQKKKSIETGPIHMDIKLSISLIKSLAVYYTNSCQRL